MIYEEQYLREELNQRIMYLYKHSASLMVTMVTIWTAIAGFAVVLSEKVADSGIIFSIIIPLCLFFSLIFVLLSSLKFKENNLQITKIAAYIACFCNCPARKRGNANMWEIANMDMDTRMFEHDSRMFYKGSKEIRDRMNGEYIISALFATALEIAVIAVQCIRSEELNGAYIACGSLLLLISLLCDHLVWKNTNQSKYKKEHIRCLKLWYVYGKNIGFNFEPTHDELIKDIIGFK